MTQELKNGDVVGVVLASDAADASQQGVGEYVGCTGIRAQSSSVELPQNHGQRVELGYSAQDHRSSRLPAFLEDHPGDVRNQGGGFGTRGSAGARSERDHSLILEELIKH